MIYLYCDGASKGNPGPSSIGVLATDENSQTLFEISEQIGNATNNVAEWTALQSGIEKAIELGHLELSCFLDSELVVKQMNGVYKVKDTNLKFLHTKVKALVLQLKRFEIQHVPREKNKLADALANKAFT